MRVAEPAIGLMRKCAKGADGQCRAGVPRELGLGQFRFNILPLQEEPAG